MNFYADTQNSFYHFSKYDLTVFKYSYLQLVVMIDLPVLMKETADEAVSCAVRWEHPTMVRTGDTESLSFPTSPPQKPSTQGLATIPPMLSDSGAQLQAKEFPVKLHRISRGDGASPSPAMTKRCPLCSEQT